MTNPTFIVPWRLPTAPDEYEHANEQKFRRILELALAKPVPETVTAGSGQLPLRRVTRLITPPMDDAGIVQGEVTLPGTAGAVLLRLTSQGPGWFRLYANDADRVLDTPRTIDTPPTTPLILDANFGLVNPVAAPLSRTAWVAGPGCQGAGSFLSATDGDFNTRWTQAASQAIGDTFSVDFGSVVTMRSVELDCSTSATDYPNFLSVETSPDGTVWTMLVPSVRGTQITRIIFSQDIATRYMRFKITDVNHFGFYFWSIVEFRAYLASANNISLRLMDGAQDGILAFNRDEPAAEKLYYRLVGDPTAQTQYIGNNTFLNGRCCSWGPPATCDEQFCDHKEPQWLDNVAWYGMNDISPADYRWRYYQNFGELRAITLNNHVARATVEVSDMVGLRFRFVAHRDANTEQSQAFSALVCSYLSNTPTLGAWDTVPYLRCGLVRAGDGTVQATIEWTTDGVSFTNLASGSAVTMGLNATLTVTGGIYANGGGPPVCRVYVADVLQCEANVPSGITDLTATHTFAGLYMGTSAPPAAPLAYGALGLTSLNVYAMGRAIIDIGYTPIERPGGTLIFVGA